MAIIAIASFQQSCASARHASTPDPIGIRVPATQSREDGDSHWQVEMLGKMIRSPDPEKRFGALISLREIGDRRASGLISIALDDTSPLMRMSAIEAIAAIEGAGAYDRIVPMLLDPVPDVRKTAVASFEDPGFIVALGSLKDTARNDPDPSVRELARSVLSRTYGRRNEGLGP